MDLEVMVDAVKAVTSFRVVLGVVVEEIEMVSEPKELQVRRKVPSSFRRLPEF
jgi:hypothetical protein